MGSIESHDCPPVRDDERQELSLNNTPTEINKYLQHIHGEVETVCLKEIPWELQDSLCLYERINFSFNAINIFPPDFPLRMPHLNYINLNSNAISRLPESFGLFFHLKTLLMNHNMLTDLPSTFVKLIKLEIVDLSSNILESLPEDIGRMESLQKINIADNLLTSLPLSLGLSQTLTLLISTGNKLNSPPQSLCNEGSKVTIAFIKKQCNAREMVKPDNLRDKFNEFPRVRGDHIQSDVYNPQSAHVQYIQAQTHTMNTTSRIKTPLLPPLKSSRFQSDELSDRIVGLIYGAAIGDALGLCTKDMTPDEAFFHYGDLDLDYGDKVVDEIRVRWKTGDWTDVFDQMMVILDSVISWAGVVDELDFVSRLDHWSRCGFPELGDEAACLSSPVTKEVLHDSHFLKDPHSVAAMLVQNGRLTYNKELTNLDICNGNHVYANDIHIKHGHDDEALMLDDNGALSRSIILGVPYFYKLSEVEANSVRICQSTHAAPPCVAGGVTLSVLVALLIQGAYKDDDADSISELIRLAGVQGRAYISDKGEVEMFDKHLAFTDLTQPNLTEEGNTTHVPKALSAGLTVLRDTSLDFKSGILSVVKQCGDSTTNGCIAGALLGCRIGYQRLPKKWVNGLAQKERDWLNVKVNALLDMMGIP